MATTTRVTTGFVPTRSPVRYCPECGARLAVRRNRNTNQDFLACPNYFVTGCKHTEPMPEDINMARMGAARLPGMEEE
jgi:ssDNA-binding Zn-finger/Zn-ribbon topoisomerase 1